MELGFELNNSGSKIMLNHHLFQKLKLIEKKKKKNYGIACLLAHYGFSASVCWDEGMKYFSNPSTSAKVQVDRKFHLVGFSLRSLITPLFVIRLNFLGSEKYFGCAIFTTIPPKLT
jgi:hypothetical protein